MIQKFITLDNLFNRLICKKYWEIENSHYGRSSSRTRSSKPGDRNWNERLVLSIVEDCKLDSSGCLFIWKLNTMLIVARVTQLLSGISFPYKYRIPIKILDWQVNFRYWVEIPQQQCQIAKISGGCGESKYAIRGRWNFTKATEHSMPLWGWRLVINICLICSRLMLLRVKGVTLWERLLLFELVTRSNQNKIAEKALERGFKFELQESSK